MGTFAVVGAKLLGIWDRLLALLKAVFGWIIADWRNGPLVVFAAGFAILLLIRIPALENDRDLAQSRWEAEITAHEKTVKNYREAAAAAIASAQANVTRVSARQNEVTQEIVDDYEARLADARDRAAQLERMRRAARTAANSGRASTAYLPVASTAASGAYAASGQDRFPATTAEATAEPVLSPTDALIATEQAIQLDALIDWVERQSAIPFIEETVSD